MWSPFKCLWNERNPFVLSDIVLEDIEKSNARARNIGEQITYGLTEPNILGITD